jgi:hypothetical protein
VTLDVSIGKVITERDEETNKPFLAVECCPDATYSIADPTYTLYPKGAYRSGSTTFWEFFLKDSKKLRKIYMSMRKNPFTNDFDVAYLKPYSQQIQSLRIKDFRENNKLTRDRLKWLQYWTKKAVELYGEEAGIMFS